MAPSSTEFSNKNSLLLHIPLFSRMIPEWISVKYVIALPSSVNKNLNSGIEILKPILHHPNDCWALDHTALYQKENQILSKYAMHNALPGL